jgi:hypothetical protein
MISHPDLRSAVVLLLAVSLACSPARALVNLNDGHDHVFVSGSATMGWDSNLFANSEAKSDYSFGTTLTAEYQRRAGWIGVNASVSVESNRYNTFKEENFNNPRFALELTKQTGRTTGSFTLNAARQSRADAAVNMRSTSWSYVAGLNFRYPIVTIYTLSGQIGYSFVKYVEGVFPDLATYSASTDLIRLLSNERDLMLGYRYRHSETSVHSSYDDHAFTAGLSGKLIRGFNGTVRAGYQIRQPHGFTDDGKPQSPYSSWTASASATYAFNKRTTFTGTVAKDFSTTATDTSVDTTTATVDMQFAYSSHWSLTASTTAGDSRFLGDSGRLVISLGPPVELGAARHDQYLTANVGINYSLNEHLKIAATYVWFKNWSNSSYAEFVRSAYNLNVSSRW